MGLRVRGFRASVREPRDTNNSSCLRERVRCKSSCRIISFELRISLARQSCRSDSPMTEEQALGCPASKFQTPKAEHEFHASSLVRASRGSVSARNHCADSHQPIASRRKRRLHIAPRYKATVEISSVRRDRFFAFASPVRRIRISLCARQTRVRALALAKSGSCLQEQTIAMLRWLAFSSGPVSNPATDRPKCKHPVDGRSIFGGRRSQKSPLACPLAHAPANIHARE